MFMHIMSVTLQSGVDLAYDYLVLAQRRVTPMQVRRPPSRPRSDSLPKATSIHHPSPYPRLLQHAVP